MHDIYPSNRSDGNWYVLAAGLPSPTKPLVLAPGLSVRPLSSELTVFDLAAAGGVGFREWATLEPLVTECTCEIESAKDSDTSPGYDTLNRGSRCRPVPTPPPDVQSGVPSTLDRDSPDQTNFPGYSSFWDTVKYNPAFQGHQMRPDSLKFPVFI